MHPNTPQVVGAAFVSGMSSGVSSEGSKPFLPPVSPQPGAGDPNVLSGSRAVHGYFLVLGISEAPASLGAPFLLPLVGDRVLWKVGTVLPPIPHSLRHAAHPSLRALTGAQSTRRGQCGITCHNRQLQSQHRTHSSGTVTLGGNTGACG